MRTHRDGASNPRRGVVLTVTAALLFGVNASVSKVALEAGIDPQALTILRCVGAAAGLGLIVLATDRGRFRLSRREIPQLVAYGVVGVALVQWLYFVAIDRLSVSLALLLEYTAPVIVALWARFVLKEDVRSRVWLSLALALSGLTLVAQLWSDVGTLDTVGVVAALGAACSLAAFWLIGERAVVGAGAAQVRPRDPVSLSFWGFVIASALWLPVAPSRLDSMSALAEPASLLGVLSEYTVPTWCVVLVVVIFGTITPFVLEMSALRHLSSTRVGMIAMLEPVLATIVAWLWLEQALTGWQALGVLVVITGLVLAQTARRVEEPTTLGAVPVTHPAVDASSGS